MTMFNSIYAAASIAVLAVAVPVAAQTAAIGPAEAIAGAAASPKGEIEATVEFVVGSTGESGFNVYLNSEADFRSSANFTAQLVPETTNALRAKSGGHPVDTMKGKRVRVTGVVRRIAVPTRDGGTTHQTRIEISSPSQIEILG